MLTPEEEIGVLERIAHAKAIGKAGLTIAKLLWAKHVLDSQDVPTEGRMMCPPDEDEED